MTRATRSTRPLRLVHAFATTAGLVVATSAVALATSAAAAVTPVLSLVTGEIERVTVDDPADVWSGGRIVVGGQVVILPRNLLLDLPANRLTLQQLFARAPQACLSRHESGLGKADACNTTATGGFATITATRVATGDVIAGDAFLEKGREIVSGAVTYLSYTDGYLRLNGVEGDPDAGVMVRLNDPTSRHTVQSGRGCLAGAANCSPDPRFTLDPDNYTAAFSTGYPVCLPSTTARTFTDTIDVNRNQNTTEQITAQAAPDGSGDVLCPQANRRSSGIATDARLLAPVELGDHLLVKGAFETVDGVRFLSASSMKVSVALETTAAFDQPDYMTIDEMFMDAPGFQRQRIRDQFIGATTAVDSDVVIWSVHRDPGTNDAHEFPLATVAGCEAVSGPLTCRQVLGPHTFRVRHEALFLANSAKNVKLDPCAQWNADPRFRFAGVCPNGGTLAEEFGMLSPVPHEVQARTGRKIADRARVGGEALKTVDILGHEAPNGQYLFPMGIGLGGIELPDFVEININALGTPASFDGIPWNLDRRLSPNGCVGPCEAGPQPLDPFPVPGFDPRTASLPAGVPTAPYNDPNFTARPLTSTANRILSYVDPQLGIFDGDATVLSWPPRDPAAVGVGVTPALGAARALVTGFAPVVGAVGATVTIDGVGLSGTTGVSFGGVPATTFANISGTQVSADVPAGALSGPIEVTTPTGVVASASRFTIVTPPTIAAVSPLVAPVGATVTVTGTGFTVATGVALGALPTTFSVVSDTLLRASIPAGAVDAPVTVTNPAGSVTGTDVVVIGPTPPPPPPPGPPTITGFAPSNGPPGTVVTVVGTNLAGATVATFEGVLATISATSPTSMVATVPAGAATGPIIVTTPGGSVTSPTMFQVSAAPPPPQQPLITSVSPLAGAPGDVVTIAGVGFTQVTSVAFNGTPATFQVGAAGILAAVPAGATSGPVSVTTPLGTGRSTVFSVLGGTPASNAPTITSFSPASTRGGGTVVVTGTGFVAVSSVTVNGRAVTTFSVASPTTMSFVVAGGTKTGPIRISAANGIATSATPLTVR